MSPRALQSQRWPGAQLGPGLRRDGLTCRAEARASGRFFIPCGALAIVLGEESLAQADRLGRDFHQLVVLDELDGGLERELDRRREGHRLVLARGAHVGQLLALYGIHDEIVVAAVDAA